MGSYEVRLANSDEELEMIYGLRYRIYVEEMKRPQRYANHDKKTISDPLDCGAYNFYSSCAGQVTGIIRMNSATRTNLDWYSEFFGFDEVGCRYGVGRAQVGIIGGFMVLPEYRGSDLAMSLMLESFRVGYTDGLRLMFLYCEAHHLRKYKMLGFKPYRDDAQHPDWGRVTQMVLDASDTEHLQKIRSPFCKAHTELCQVDGASSSGDHALKSASVTPIRSTKRPFSPRRRARSAADHAPVRTTPWPTYDKGTVLIDRDEADAATRAIMSQRLFRYDDRALAETEVGRFESELAEFFSVKHALAVSTGTAALSLSFMALGIKPGDEVLCSAFGFAASPSSIMMAGATPVLFEVDEHLHPDLDDLESRITPRTKAVLAVHMRGQSGDIARMTALCEALGLPLVEDAVPVLGARFDGRYLGTFGTLGAFSTQSDKSLNCGEGGFLLTDDSPLFERAVALSGAYEGRVRKHCDWLPTSDHLSLPLFNFRMDEIRGAVCRSQLAKLPRRIEILRTNYETARRIVATYPELIVRQSPVEQATLGDSILFRVATDDPTDAHWLSAAIHAEGIDARSFGVAGGQNIRSFWNWKFMFPGRTTEEICALLPNTSRWLNQTIDIPLSPLLTQHDLDDMEAAFAKVMVRWRERRAKGGNRLAS